MHDFKVILFAAFVKEAQNLGGEDKQVFHAQADQLGFVTDAVLTWLETNGFLLVSGGI